MPAPRRPQTPATSDRRVPACRHAVWCLLVLALVGWTAPLTAQQSADPSAEYARLVQAANAHQRARRWAEAVATFDSAFAINTGNYTLYSATQSACQLGDSAKAMQYFAQAAPRLLPNVGNWPAFASDTMSRCVQASPLWKQFADSMRAGYDAYQRRVAAHLADIRDPARRIEPASAAARHASAAQALARLPFAEAAKRLRTLAPYAVPPVLGHWTLLEMRVPGDTLVVPYLVHVPAQYDPRRPTPLLVYLHEAVSRSIFAIGYEIDRDEDGELLVRAAHANGWLILYPLANRQLNWVDHAAALHTVEAEIAAMRRQYNVDESRIWVGGNSDGGRGALWFASRNPNIAAATFHFSTLPLISLPGGTRLENLAGASRMFAVSGGADDLFTPAKVDPLWAAMLAARAPLRRVVVPDGGHGLASTWANIAWVYDSIASVRRTGTPSTVRWSTDRIEEGRRDWISITGMDTLVAPAPWHRLRLDSLAIPGSAPATAAVNAAVRGNTITVETSRVTTLRIALPGTLIDFGKPIRLVVNGRELWNGRIRPSSTVMVAEFLHSLDRTVPVGALLSVDVRGGKAWVNP